MQINDRFLDLEPPHVFCPSGSSVGVESIHLLRSPFVTVSLRWAWMENARLALLMAHGDGGKGKET